MSSWGHCRERPQTRCLEEQICTAAGSWGQKPSYQQGCTPTGGSGGSLPCLFWGPLAFLGSGGPPPTPSLLCVWVSLLYVPSTHPFDLRSPIYDHLTLRLLTQSHCKYPFSKPGHVHGFQRLVVHDIPPAGSLSNLRQRLNVMKCAPLTPCVEIPSFCTSEYNYIWR